jgi:hypothetical protein
VTPDWAALGLAEFRTWFGINGGCYADFKDEHGQYRMVGADGPAELYKACLQYVTVKEQSSDSYELIRHEGKTPTLRPKHPKNISTWAKPEPETVPSEWTKAAQNQFNEEIMEAIRKVPSLTPKQPKNEPSKPKPNENPWKRRFG